MQQELVEKLSEVRRRLRLFHGIKGLGILLVLTFGFAWVSLLMDSVFHLGTTFRWVMLFVGVGGVTTVLIAWFLFPLFRPIWDEEVALLVEDTHPQLQERLISTLQLKRSALPEGILGSRELISALEHQTAQALRPMPVADSIRFFPLRRIYALTLLLVGGLGGLKIYQPDLLTTWWTRFWDPYSDVAWTHTKLDLEPKNAMVPQGEALTVTALAYQSGTPVDKVTLYTHYAGDKWTPLATTKSDDRHFTYTFPEVHKPFRYYAKAGDAKTYTYDVQVVPRPAIMGVLLKYTYPAYTKKADREDKGDGMIQAIKGTQIELIGRASTDLKAGTLDLLIGNEKTSIPLSVHGLEVRGRFTVRGSGTYALNVISKMDLANKDKFERPIEAQDDLVPIVAIPVPGAEQKCTPTATIQDLLATASDDYGLADRGWLKAVKDGDETAKAVIINLLWQKAPTQISFGETKAVIALGALGALKPGDAVKYWAEARDTNPVGPGLGKSEEYRILIVSDEDKQRDLARQLENIYAQVLEALKVQQALTKDTDVLRKKNMQEPSVKNEVAQAERRQNDLTDMLKDVEQKFDQLHQDYLNNKMGSEEEMKRLTPWQKEAADLADRDMPQAERQLAQARQDPNAESAQQHAKEAQQQEEQNQKQLEQLARELGQQVEPGIIAQEIEEIRKLQEEARSATKNIAKELAKADYDPEKLSQEIQNQQADTAKKQENISKRLQDLPQFKPLADRLANPEQNLPQLSREAEQKIEQSAPQEALPRQDEIMKGLDQALQEAKAAEAQANRPLTPAESAKKEAKEAKEAAAEAKEAAEEAKKAAENAEKQAKKGQEEAKQDPKAKEQSKKTDAAAKKAQEQAKKAEEEAKKAEEGAKEAKVGAEEAEASDQPNENPDAKASEKKAKAGEQKAKAGNQKAQAAAQKAKEARDQAEEEEEKAKKERPKSPFELSMEKLWNDLNAVLEQETELHVLTGHASGTQTKPKQDLAAHALTLEAADPKEPLAIRQAGARHRYETWLAEIEKFTASLDEEGLSKNERKAHDEMQNIIQAAKHAQPDEDMKVARAYLGRAYYAQAEIPERNAIAKLEDLLYKEGEDNKPVKGKEKKPKQKPKKEKEKEEELAWKKKKDPKDEEKEKEEKPEKSDPEESEGKGESPMDKPGENPGGTAAGQSKSPGAKGKDGDKASMSQNQAGGKAAAKTMHTTGGSKTAGPGKEVDLGILDGDWAKLPPLQLDRLLETRTDTLPMDYREAVKNYFKEISRKARKK